MIHHLDKVQLRPNPHRSGSHRNGDHVRSSCFFRGQARGALWGALVIASPLVPMILLYDVLAAQLGWWHCSSVTMGNTPLARYVAAALAYGAAFGLVGWRVIRRFGTRGLVAFLAGFAFGVTRDYLYSITIGLIIIMPGLVPLVADLFAYSSAASLVQLLTYRIAGSPRSGTLARMPPGRVAPNS